MTPKSSIMTITPEVAMEILARSMSAMNRKPNQYRIKLYARDMKDGKWKVTGQGLTLGKNGILYDGQHRLLACILAGVPFTTAVLVNPEVESVVGLPVDIQNTRTTSFVCGLDRHSVSVVNHLLFLASGNYFKQSNDVILKLANFSEAYTSGMIKANLTGTSMATVRSAALLAAHESGSMEPIEQYNLCQSRSGSDGLWPITESFRLQTLVMLANKGGNKAATVNRIDIGYRAFKAFSASGEMRFVGRLQVGPRGLETCKDKMMSAARTFVAESGVIVIAY